MTLPTTRRQALAEGSPRYFTGEPCVHGHVAPRFTSGCGCNECHRLASAAYYAQHKDRFMESMRRWQAENPGRYKELQKKYHDKKLAERQQEE